MEPWRKNYLNVLTITVKNGNTNRQWLRCHNHTTTDIRLLNQGWQRGDFLLLTGYGNKQERTQDSVHFRRKLYKFWLVQTVVQCKYLTEHRLQKDINNLIKPIRLMIRRDGFFYVFFSPPGHNFHSVLTRHTDFNILYEYS